MSEAGVLLKIVRNNRWVEIFWLVMALVAMVAPLHPRTMSRTSSLSGLWLRSSIHGSPRSSVLCKCHPVSVHFDFLLALFLDMFLAEPLTSSIGQVSPIVWYVKWEPRLDLLPILDGPAERHSRAANWT